MSNFWARPTTEPKRRYRFELSFSQRAGNVLGSIPVWTVKTATKPRATISSVEHAYIDNTFKFPGRVTWDPISVTLVDPVEPDLSYSFLDALGAAGYKYPTNPIIAKKSLSKKGFVGSIGSVFITQLNDQGVEIERWELVNPFITSIDFGGSLDYTSDEMTEVSVELTYDWAKLTLHGGNKITPSAADR